MAAPAESVTLPAEEGRSAAPMSAPDSSASAPAAASGTVASTLLKPSKPFTCLVLGASGATGRVLVGKLANNPRVERINAIVRKELPSDYFGSFLPAQSEKIVQTVVDYDNLDASADSFKGYNTAFCCLGSTRSQAGSKEAFHQQDYVAITNAARLAKAGGVYHFNLVSTTGASPTSVFYYLKEKAATEQNLTELRFPSLSIYRPGLLLTERASDRPKRWGEWFAQKIVPALHAILPERHCGVYTQTVAEAMILNTEHALATVEKENGGVDGAEQIAASVGASQMRIFENDEIRGLKVARL